MTAKRWFELECRHCGRRFIETVKLVFHECPTGDAARAAREQHRATEGVADRFGGLPAPAGG